MVLYRGEVRDKAPDQGAADGPGPDPLTLTSDVDPEEAFRM